jgi:Ca2+/Na+ antiporter
MKTRRHFIILGHIFFLEDIKEHFKGFLRMLIFSIGMFCFIISMLSSLTGDAKNAGAFLMVLIICYFLSFSTKLWK